VSHYIRIYYFCDVKRGSNFRSDLYLRRQTTCRTDKSDLKQDTW